MTKLLSIVQHGDMKSASLEISERISSVDVCILDKSGKSALQIAARSGCVPIVEVLLTNTRVDANIGDASRCSPIFDALPKSSISGR